MPALRATADIGGHLASSTRQTGRCDASWLFVLRIGKVLEKAANSVQVPARSLKLRVSPLCLYEHYGECFAGYQVPPKRAFRPLQSGHRSSL